jgi:ABC-type transport system involved in multi-copper enzyme maturation permease subunit
MWRTVFRKELLENILGYRFPLFFLISAVLILTSLYVRELDYGKRVRDYSEQVRLAGEELAAARPVDLHFGRIPLRGFLPPSPLAVFAAGFETSLPKFYDFNAEGPKPGNTSVSEESVLSVFGQLDFLFIVQMVASLIVLLFASDMIAGEKEMGTLRVMLANSTPRHSVLWGKFLGGFTAVWLPFLVVFLVGAILLGLLAFPLGQAGVPARLVLVFLASTVFLLAYFGLGLLVSASSGRSRTALIAILLVWIVLQVALPRLSDMVAAVVHPVPTETVVAMQKSVVVKTVDNETARELGRQYEALFGRGTPYSTEPEPEAKRKEWEAFKSDLEARAAERKSSQLREIESAYQREKARQRTIALNLSLISPSAAFTRLLTDLCGTGEIDRARYLDAVRAHQQTLDAALYSHLHRTTVIMPSGGTASGSSIDQLVDPKSLPAFSFSRAGLADVLAGNWGSLISIAFWLIAPFAAAYVRFIKYDVR